MEKTDRRSPVFSLIIGPASLSWDGWKGQPTDVTLRSMLSQQNNPPCTVPCPPRKINRAISPTFTPKGASCLERSRKNQSCAIAVKNEERNQARGKRYARKVVLREIQQGSEFDMRATWLQTDLEDSVGGKLATWTPQIGKERRLKMFYCESTSSKQASDLDFAFRIVQQKKKIEQGKRRNIQPISLICQHTIQVLTGDLGLLSKNLLF